MVYQTHVLSLIEQLNGYNERMFVTSSLDDYGLSSRVVLGPILNEWNARHQSIKTEYEQYVADWIALFNTRENTGGLTHDEVKREFARIQYLESWKVQDAELWNDLLKGITKFTSPISIDVGVGNFQIATAINLLDEYTENNPDSDPYLIKHYENNYDDLVYDLLRTDISPDTTITFTVLMLEKAVEWFEEHAQDWEAYSVAEKEGLLVYFYKAGEEFMNSKLDESGEKISFNLAATPIISEYLENREAIGTAIKFYGGTVIEPNPENVKLTLTNATTNEGGTLEFVVKINGGEPVEHDITFTATTYQGTTSNFVNGLSPDYDGVNRTYTIQAGQTQVVVYVPTDRDEKYEKNETVELRISNPIGAKISDGIAIGTITDDDEKSLTLTLENFEIDINRFLEDGDDPRVSYIISHDGDENLSSVKLRWYATKNGEVDDDAIFLGYESAGTLRVGEHDSEGEDLEPLMDLSGDWKIVTTAEYQGLDDPIVLRVDEVSLSQPLPEMQSVTLDNEQWVNEDNDLRIDYVLHNPTDDDMRGFEIKFYASKSNKFDTDTAIYLDRESGGTLRVGEEDNEGETIQAAADLDAGDWNLYSVAYWDGHEDGVVLSTDEFTVAGNSSSVDLSIDNFRLDDNTLEQGQDLVVRQTSINYGSEDARGTETTYYWSADKHLNVNEDTILDKDGHGTLRAGEHDTNEYERIDYEDLPKGLGYVFAYIDADQEFDEGLMNELNNHSDWQALYVA